MRQRLLFLALVAGLAACSTAAHEGRRLGPLGLVAPPVTVAPDELAAHTGEMVTLRARAGQGRVERGRIVFPIEAEGALQANIVVVPPLLSASSDSILAKFSGHEVLVIGRVSDLGGRLEILTGDANRLELAGGREGDTK